MPIRTALFGIVPPVLIAAAVLLAAWRPWTRRAGARPGWGGALALSLAYAAADTLVAGRWPGFPAVEAHRWLPYVGVAAALLTFVLPRRSEWLGRTAIVLAVAGPCMVLLTSDVLFAAATWMRAAVWAVAGAIAVAVVAGAASRDGRFTCGPRVSVTLLIASAGAAIALVQHQSALFSQMAGAIAAALGVVAVLSWWRPAREEGVGGELVFALLYVGLLVTMPVRPGSGMALAAAACAPGIGAMPGFSRLRAWQITVVCWALAAALAAVGIWLSPSGFDFSGLE